MRLPFVSGVNRAAETEQCSRRQSELREMSSETLKPKRWYWVRRDDGSLAAYPLYRVSRDLRTGVRRAEFFVGSFVRSWPASRVVGEAQMPESGVKPESRE